MATLKTNYKSDVLADSMNNTRKFNIIDGEGNIVASNCTIQDVSTYEQVGDKYTAEDVNTTNREVNSLRNEVEHMGFKVLKQGTITQTTTINLFDDETESLDPTKYIINLSTNYHQDEHGNFINAYIDGTGNYVRMAWAYGMGAWWTNKTDKAVTINVSTGITCSYEIIQIAK